MEVDSQKENITQLFKDYLNDGDTEKLIEKLTEIETELYQYEYYDDDDSDDLECKLRHLWFRFFRENTAATTISDIKNCLNNPTQRNNYHYIHECMEIAINNNSLEVYYS